MFTNIAFIYGLANIRVFFGTFPKIEQACARIVRMPPPKINEIRKPVYHFTQRMPPKYVKRIHERKSVSMLHKQFRR